MHGLHLRFATARSMIDEVRSMTKANEVAGKIAGGSSLNEPADVVRRLRGGDVPVYVERVRTPDDSARLVVVERMARVGLTDEQAAECLREAETAATLEHENLVRTCGIVVQRNEISVASDYVDGERLSELWQPATERQATAPLGILVRILLDVLAGLGALHKLRDRDEQLRHPCTGSSLGGARRPPGRHFQRGSDAPWVAHRQAPRGGAGEKQGHAPSDTRSGRVGGSLGSAIVRYRGARHGGRTGQAFPDGCRHGDGGAQDRRQSPGKHRAG